MPRPRFTGNGGSLTILLGWSAASFSTRPEQSSLHHQNAQEGCAKKAITPGPRLASFQFQHEQLEGSIHGLAQNMCAKKRIMLRLTSSGHSLNPHPKQDPIEATPEAGGEFETSWYCRYSITTGAIDHPPNHQDPTTASSYTDDAWSSTEACNGWHTGGHGDLPSY